MDLPIEHHDILIVGAGLSGINTAHVLREKLPHRSVAIIEKRDVLGGTWSLFQYPGFRSDSYMSSFGFGWFPWQHRHKMAPASEILAYIAEAAEASGIRELIRFGHEAVSYEWRSEEQKWRITVEVKDGEQQQKTKKVLVANFIFGCGGYYSYDKALEAVIPGIESFGGEVVHPQWWPGELDYANKRIVIIGSGATAITILPALAETAAHVTMLQRSPSFVVSRANSGPLDWFLSLFLPSAWVRWLIWYYDVLYEIISIQLLLTFPQIARLVLSKRAKMELPDDIDVDVHFNPSYNPFQQRLCICPDGDFFKALHQPNCEIVTDVIDTVTKDGILLQSGQRLDADIIVTATGLYFQLFGGLAPLVDGQPIHPGDKYTWRGCLLESLPNTAFILGYVTQSWTPGADAMAKTVVKILERMERTGATSVTPVMEKKEGMPRKLAIGATSNYFLKAADRIPKVTGKAPWYGRTNLVVDIWAKYFGSLEDGLVYVGGNKDKKNA